MKPVSIELQAFGPFAEKEYVDFEKLSEDGLFLIRGKTGSGKTMLLDAITYALYGKSSGENRNDIAELRCNRCDPNIDTFVRFRFREGNNTYVFERSLEKRRTAFSKHGNVYRVLEDGSLEPLLENPKDTAITAKAVEMIGLSFDQFRQVIILPQGKFEKLLTSDSNEKEDILTTIFGTEIWKIIVEKYYTRAAEEKKALDDIQGVINSRLDEEGCSSIDELRDKVTEKTSEKKDGQTEYISLDLEGRKKQLIENKTLAAEFRTLNNFKSKIDALESRSEEAEKKRTDLDKAEKAENLRKPLEEKKKAGKELNRRREVVSKAEEDAETAKKGKDRIQEQLTQHEEIKDAYEQWQREKVELEAKKPEYASLSDAETELKKAEKDYANAVKKYEAAEKVHLCNIEKADKALKDYQQAMRENIAVSESYRKGIIGNLAAELSDNMPCPVCGSTSHPQKADVIEGIATDEDVKKAKKKMSDCEKRSETANRERNSSEKEQEEARKELSEKKYCFDTATASFDKIREALIEGIESLEALNDRIQLLEDKIQQYDDESKVLKETFDRSALELKGKETAYETATAEFSKSEEMYRMAETDCAVKVDCSDFADIREAEEALLDAEIRNRLRDEINEYDVQLRENRELYENKLAELKGIEAPDIDSIDRELHEIERKTEEHNIKQGSLTREIERLEEKINNLEVEQKKYDDRIQEVSSDLAFARGLRGEVGIGLHRYVQGIMFSSVIVAANELLAKVHGGRYRLYRSDSAAAGKHKRGLSLKVYDSYSDNSEGRDVSTLSGGEKFLASLALSLGMSSVAKTGGVDIEGMFIDEGFGTLDESSVDDALDVLKSIKSMNGSVGIISHMDVLAASIPSQIIIEKEKETSTIKLV